MGDDTRPETTVTAERADSTRWLETAFVALLPFLGWWQYGLFDLDEGFYGAVASEMNRRHEWVTPYFNGRPWFEKPILLYWTAKPSISLFGDMVGPRLPSVLATLLTIYLLARFAQKHFSPLTAQLSVFIMSGSLLPVAVGRQMMCDPLLVLCLTGAFLAVWNSLESRTTLYRALAGFLVGLAVLAKGPVSLILFPLIVGWFYWREPELRPKFKGGWIAFVIAALAAIATWYIPVYLANPKDFVQGFLIDQNLKRFTGGDDAHNAGILGLPLYAVVLVVGMFPWCFYALRNWPRGPSSSPLNRYLATWAGLIFLFFTVSGTKLPHYVLPCCPPLAVLAADFLARRSRDQKLKRLWDLSGPLSATLICALLAQIGLTLYYKLSGHEEVHKMADYVKSQPEKNVAVYQMPRREKDLGTFKPKIQETSHPSLVMYLDRVVTEAETMEQLYIAPHPIWVITRADRISDDDVATATMRGFSLSEMPLPYADNYRIFLMRQAKK